MSIVQRIKDLADAKNTNFAEIERAVGLSNGQIRRWDNVSPKTENVEKVADHFGVSVDFLLGRNIKENKPAEIEPEDLDEMLDNAMSFDGKPLTEVDKEAIRAFLQGRLSSK